MKNNTQLTRTHLYNRHVALGGKIVDFSGFELPIQYKSIMSEHKAVRETCGLFDVSHLGEIKIKGKDSYDFLSHLVPTSLDDLQKGMIRYTIMLNPEGGVLDDILIYKESDEDFFLVVNAGNIQKMYQHITSQYESGDIEIRNESDKCSCIAIQGPNALKVCESAYGDQFKDMPYYSFKQLKSSEGDIWISRTGYTGEDGFEFFSGDQGIGLIWDNLLEIGKEHGLVPAGLGCRNTLRLEVGNCLYGHEMDESVTPYESRLGWLVNEDKDFLGKEALLKRKESIRLRVCGFVMLEKSIARDGYEIFNGQEKIGSVTSGSVSPSLGKNIGLARVEKNFAKIGSQFEISVHGKRAQAEVIKLPFVPIRHL